MNLIHYRDLDPVRKVLCHVQTSTNQDLARQLGWSDAKTSRTVDAMVAAGQVVKVRDGQAVKIALPRRTHVYQMLFKPVVIADP